MTISAVSTRRLHQVAKVGPVTTQQMTRLNSVWDQGQHVMVSGPTGSGKSTLAKLLYDIRYDRGGFVVVIVCKPRRDDLITDLYLRHGGYERWTRWRPRMARFTRRIVLWPDTTGLRRTAEILAHQREVIVEALDDINDQGNRTVGVDDGLYMTSPAFLDLADDIGMMHAMGRSHGITMVNNLQRPSHYPLITYSSASQAFVGQTRELSDRKRLAELGATESSRELESMIHRNTRHGFTWIPVAPGWPAEQFDLTR